MVGFLSKDFTVLKRVSDEVANATTTGNTAALPTLIYPAHLFPVKDKAASALYEKVVVSLERVLQVTRRVVNFAEEWARISGNKEGFYEYFAPVSYRVAGWRRSSPCLLPTGSLRLPDVGPVPWPCRLPRAV
jgi:hypothetical protein